MYYLVIWCILCPLGPFLLARSQMIHIKGEQWVLWIFNILPKLYITLICVLYYSIIIAKHNYTMHMEVSLHCNIIIYSYIQAQLQDAIAYYK